MKPALFCNLNVTKVYTNLEKYVIRQLNFMPNLFTWIYSGGGEQDGNETRACVCQSLSLDF
jgi:hypothetical protein